MTLEVTPAPTCGAGYSTDERRPRARESNATHRRAHTGLDALTSPANGVLQRFGFAAAEPVASAEAVVAALDADHYDLVVLPLKSLS